jgi:hypothetical protein
VVASLIGENCGIEIDLSGLREQFARASKLTLGVVESSRHAMYATGEPVRAERFGVILEER